MTNELEKQFFDTFGIEPINYIKDFPTREKAAAFGRKITGIPKHSKGKFEIGSYTNNIDIFQVHWKEYPQITDRILLELICTLNKFTGYTSLLNDTYEEVKEEILKDVLFAHEQLRLNKTELSKQVRTLFEEG